MFIVCATSLVVFIYCCATADIYSNASCFSLLWLYLGHSQVSVCRTIGPTLVCFYRAFITVIFIWRGCHQLHREPACDAKRTMSFVCTCP